VFDLLNGRKKLNILEDGKKQVCVVGLKVSRVAGRVWKGPIESGQAGAGIERGKGGDGGCRALGQRTLSPSLPATAQALWLDSSSARRRRFLSTHLLQEHVVDDVEVVKQLIEEANMHRSTGSTAANADSSRSHSIMQFALKRYIAGGAHCRQVRT
jgi:hypothetical protein